MARILPLWLFLFNITVYAQSLSTALKSRPDLSMWYHLVQPQWSDLDTLDNITFFAPHNDAMLAYFNTSQISGCATSDPSILQALTSYHTLQQAYESLPGSSYFNMKLVDSDYSPNGDNLTWVITPLASEADWNADATSVVSGLGTTSNFVGTPITFDRGLIYVIDTVLQLPANTVQTLTAAGYTAFAGMIQSTLNEDVVNVKGIDVHAPTNEAFQDVGDIMQLLSADDARAIVLYHCVQRHADGLGSEYRDGSEMTLEGSNITTVNSSSSPSYVNNAMLVDSEYFFSTDANNIWVIDRVLNPNNATAPINSTAWPSASRVSYVPFASVIAYPAIPVCEKPAWLESISAGSKKTDVGAIAGGLVGGLVGLALVILGVFCFMRRRRRTQPDYKQELDGTETFGKPEIKGSESYPTELEVDRHHELGTEEGKVFEMPASDVDRAELETPISRTGLISPVSKGSE